MEAVGFLGISMLTIQIIRRSLKHFLCIAMLWAIPFAFHFPLLDLSCFALDALSSSLYTLTTVSKLQFPSPAALPPHSYDTDAPFPKLPLSSVLYLFISVFFFPITVPLISYPLLTFSVCRACLNKSFTLKGSLLGVLRSAKNLALTSLCVGAVSLGFTAMPIGTTGIIAGVVVVVRGNDPATASIVWLCIVSAMGMAGLYLAVSFSLAHIVAILEEKSAGWEAMRRSMELLNGRKWVALGLVCVVYGVLQICEFSESWGWRGARIVTVSLKALITLFGMAAHVVLYMSCKSQRKEPLNTLIAASARFGPQESWPNSRSMVDVETSAFLLTAVPK